MKTLLLLGGSRQQVPVIEKAKSMGYRTVLIDYLQDNPGQYVADKWYPESTTDIEAVCRIAEKEKVNGILAYASDPAALPAAIVCERLGLPTNPAESVAVLGVKHKFRDFLKKHNFACPQTFTFSPTDSHNSIVEGLSSLSFPIVIKPTDSSGSKGVSFLADTGALQKSIKEADKYSRNKILIAEEFIERGFPDVIGGDIFVENGQITLYGDMACLRGDNGRSLIPIGEKLPNGLTENQKRHLYEELQRLIDELHMTSGELNIEVIIDKEGQPHFLEVGPRAGGNMIPIQLSDAYGVDLLEANINAAMGKPCGLHPRHPEECFATFVLNSEKDGVFDGYKLSAFAEQHLYREVIYKEIGEPIERFNGAAKALGILFFRFDNSADMESLYGNYADHINVVVISKTGGAIYSTFAYGSLFGEERRAA